MLNLERDLRVLHYNLYYKPNIEEFVEGFEYEYCSDERKQGEYTIIQTWDPYRVGHRHTLHKDQIEKGLKENKIRGRHKIPTSRFKALLQKYDILFRLSAHESFIITKGGAEIHHKFMEEKKTTIDEILSELNIELLKKNVVDDFSNDVKYLMNVEGIKPSNNIYKLYKSIIYNENEMVNVKKKKNSIKATPISPMEDKILREKVAAYRNKSLTKELKKQLENGRILNFDIYGLDVVVLPKKNGIVNDVYINGVPQHSLPQESEEHQKWFNDNYDDIKKDWRYLLDLDKGPNIAGRPTNVLVNHFKGFLDTFTPKSAHSTTNGSKSVRKARNGLGRKANPNLKPEDIDRKPKVAPGFTGKNHAQRRREMNAKTRVNKPYTKFQTIEWEEEPEEKVKVFNIQVPKYKYVNDEKKAKKIVTKSNHIRRIKEDLFRVFVGLETVEVRMSTKGKKIKKRKTIVVNNFSPKYQVKLQEQKKIIEQLKKLKEEEALKKAKEKEEQKKDDKQTKK